MAWEMCLWLKLTMANIYRIFMEHIQQKEVSVSRKAADTSKIIIQESLNFFLQT